MTGQNRKIYVTTVQKKMREAAMEETLKAYAALPLEWRKAIAEEAGLDILKLSRASQEQRREMQKAARRIADRPGMGYFVRAVIVITKACTE